MGQEAPATLRESEQTQVSEIQQETAMKLSARNQLAGRVVAVQRGQTTAHVRIDITEPSRGHKTPLATVVHKEDA